MPRTVISHTWRDWYYSAAALFLLVLLRLSLPVLPFRLIRALAQPGISGDSGPAARRKAQMIGRAVNRAAVRVPGARCLARAITAALLLRFAGLPYRIRLGVRRIGSDEFSAHAWVLSGNTIVTGELPDLETYQPLSLESAARTLR